MKTSPRMQRAATTALTLLLTLVAAALAQVVSHGADTTMLPAASHGVVSGSR